MDNLVEVPVEKYPGGATLGSTLAVGNASNNLNVRKLGRGDSRESWDPIRSAREREFREKPPPMLKVAIVGDSAVGKTTICEALTSETGFTFSKKYQMTCGVQVYAKSQSIQPPDGNAGEDLSSSSSVLSLSPPSENLTRVNLILLDSSSKDIYLDLLPKYWEKLDAVCVVTDVTNPASLENCATWLELVKPNMDAKLDYLGVLIGNKIDYGEDRTVTTKQAQEFAQKHKLHYFEATAKENSGLEEPFKFLAEEWAKYKMYKS